MKQAAVNTLRIAPGLALDADYLAGASVALLGKRGAGKTYASRVLAEEFVSANVQTVIIDPMGVFWGLRAGASGGQHNGLPIPVFGGEHGDAPLDSAAGAVMADLVVEDGLSMILDLSGFGSRTQERTFVAAFLNRLYRTNKHLVHLIVDEADLFAPQKPRREDAHLLVTMENIVRRGRNKGIGISMASQRAAVLNKDVLTQIDVLMALRVAAPQDRDAIRDWVRGQGDEQQWSSIAPSLPGLENGECWCWIPEKGILKQVRVRQARTFDSSPTRTRGSSNRVPKTFADVDIAAITSRIAATIERAKETDPRLLAKRVRELEKALADRADSEPPAVDEAVLSQIEDAAARLRQARDAADMANMAATDLLGQVERGVEELRGRLQHVTNAVDAVTAAVSAAGRPAAKTPTRTPRRRRTTNDRHVPAPVAARPGGDGPATNAATASVGDLAISPARRRLLTTLAFLEGIGFAMARKAQLALWAGVSSTSSGYANNLSGLRTAGLVEYPEPGHVALTVAGRALADPVERPVTDDDLYQEIRGRITPARWRILAQLIEEYPDSLSKNDLAAAVEVSPTSSGYANNLSALRTLGLVDYPEPGQVAATDILFIGQS